MSSYGKKLHDTGMTQGSCFPACLLNEEARVFLYSTRVNIDARTPSRNKHKILDEDCLVVLSQECDIACKNDADDPLIELALFKPIEEKDLYPGNQYANSVRRIQLEIKGSWYQSDIAHISWIKKEALWKFLEFYKVEKGDESTSRTLAVWRGNRYNREPLPDNFNEAIIPLLKKILKKIDQYERDISAIYISLNTYDETDDYIFDVFALTESSVENDDLAAIMSLMEEFCDELEEGTNFKASENCIYAVRDDSITVNDISNYRRLNLDYVSLSVEPDEAQIPTTESKSSSGIGWLKTIKSWLNI